MVKLKLTSDKSSYSVSQKIKPVCIMKMGRLSVFGEILAL